MSAHRTKDITGLRFGSLTVTAFDGRASGNQLYLCRCDCGKEKTVYYCNIVNGRTKSCGCKIGESIRQKARKHGDAGRKDIASEYRAWKGIKDRCEKKDRPSYKYYGARGISVCERWRSSYEAFLEDMGRKPTPSHSIDRIDNDGNYEPSNCRWATKSEQAMNRRKRNSVTRENRHGIQ